MLFIFFLFFFYILDRINPYKPSTYYVGHIKTVETKMGCMFMYINRDSWIRTLSVKSVIGKGKFIQKY